MNQLQTHSFICSLRWLIGINAKIDQEKGNASRRVRKTHHPYNVVASCSCMFLILHGMALHPFVACLVAVDRRSSLHSATKSFLWYWMYVEST
mmetsp:Transcript_17642/g.49969  ORF Transcript_17642/g.49969 Transcript_17642/m.49969 type:complete len:93 (-) Transcript_17642:152-430(-)